MIAPNDQDMVGLVFGMYWGDLQEKDIEQHADMPYRKLRIDASIRSLYKGKDYDG